jgi:hypothetical protein
MLALLARMVVAVSVVLAVVLVLVLAVTFALLGTSAVPLPLAAAFELFKAVNLHAAGGARHGGSLQGCKLSCCCCSLQAQQQAQQRHDVAETSQPAQSDSV